MGYTLQVMFKLVETFLLSIIIPDIIALLVLGVTTIRLFLYWQHYLERIHDNPDSPYSMLTPPPLMKLSIWTRANGRMAVMMIIVFMQWSGFSAWSFWVHVRPAFPDGFPSALLTSSELNVTQLYFQNYMHYSVMGTVVRLLPMFISGFLCNIIVGFTAAYIPIVWLLGTYFFHIKSYTWSISRIPQGPVLPQPPFPAFSSPPSFRRRHTGPTLSWLLSLQPWELLLSSPPAHSSMPNLPLRMNKACWALYSTR